MAERINGNESMYVEKHGILGALMRFLGIEGKAV
jgi:hypothetical protein